MRRVVVVWVMACSGGPARTPPASPVPQPVEPAARNRVVTPQAICEQYLRLAPTCKPLANAHLAPPDCVEQWRLAMEDPQHGPRMRVYGACLVEHDECGEVVGCFSSAFPDPTRELRTCEDRSARALDHAVGIAKSEWDRRNGAGVTRVRLASSSKERPIEMCGFEAGADWLISLRCEDGSQPLHSIDDAEAARPGNVGTGGRCGSMIDHYVVPCPEQRYDVFVDLYVCPLPD